jgi:LPXTG-motif cell wall-anchored protein
MSQPKVIGPVAVAGATAASLPVTGNAVFSLALAGLGLVAAGLLLLRASRLRREHP